MVHIGMYVAILVVTSVLSIILLWYVMHVKVCIAYLHPIYILVHTMTCGSYLERQYDATGK